jgi:histidinol dehydrogenase
MTDIRLRRVDSLRRRLAASDPEVIAAVAEIIAAVRERGDAAVSELALRFDDRAPPYEIDRRTWKRRAAETSAEISAVLERAAARIRAFHLEQRERGYETDGGELAMRVVPLRRVGLYVPGGTARYPSSVLMTAIPAAVAGVDEVVMTTPTASPEALRAAEIAGVDRVFELGGAHAVAALAIGTETIPQVDKIVGPGNAWVAEAKRQVFGWVDIDSIAGPSEVLIVADRDADPAWIAADLIAQAEHDRAAQPILVTTSEPLVAAVEAELGRQLADLPRAEIATAAIVENGAAMVVDSVEAAIDAAESYAPEHLELLCDGAAEIAATIRCAGAIFVGPWSPEAAGDYLAGPNHVLPTAGAARYASPLGVYDYVKRISVIALGRERLAELAGDIRALAAVEDLDGHGRSVAIRMSRADRDDARSDS